MELKEMYQISLKTWNEYLKKSENGKEVSISSDCHFCKEVNGFCEKCRANRDICNEIWSKLRKDGILFIIKLIEKEIEKLG